MTFPWYMIKKEQEVTSVNWGYRISSITTQAVTYDVFNREKSFVYLKDAGGELSQIMAASFGYGLSYPKTQHFFLFYPVTFTIRQAMVNKTKLFLLGKTCLRL